MNDESFNCKDIVVEFDENKVINALHPEKAEVGKKYYCSNKLLDLEHYVIHDSPKVLTALRTKEHSDCFPFIFGALSYQFIYPCEEPPKQRMTNRQLLEWLAKGNGEYCCNGSKWTYTEFNYLANNGENRELDTIYKIRTWDSDEWVEPTVDIYERDCKGGTE